MNLKFQKPISFTILEMEQFEVERNAHTDSLVNHMHAHTINIFRLHDELIIRLPLFITIQLILVGFAFSTF